MSLLQIPMDIPQANDIFVFAAASCKDLIETFRIANSILNNKPKFEITKLSKSSSIFSYKKLNFFNNYYLREKNGFEKIYKLLRKS